MYTLGIKRNFIARHFLIGGDWGAENLPNSHHYVLELQLAGKELDQHGYLVDIVREVNVVRGLVNHDQRQCHRAVNTAVGQARENLVKEGFHGLTF